MFISERFNVKEAVADALILHGASPDDLAPIVEAYRRPPGGRDLLLVALDHVGRPGVGLERALAHVPPGPALAQQVPALVELDLEALEPLDVLGGQAVADVGGVQPVLLVDEMVDAVEDLLVVHGRRRYQGGASTPSSRGTPSVLSV